MVFFEKGKKFTHAIVVVAPLFLGMRHGRIPWSSGSSATPSNLDQESRIERAVAQKRLV